jgi:cytochrome c oxidase subunit 3
MGIWIALVPVLVLFLALASALVLRQDYRVGWRTVALPHILWLNTIILLASSLVLERGRRALRDRASLIAAQRWLLTALALGLLFMAGQVIAWQQLYSQGVAARTSPLGVFFFLLTGAHAVHLLGGLIGLGLATLLPARGFRQLTRGMAVRIAAIYWHFLSILWCGLLLLLVLSRR